MPWPAEQGDCDYQQPAKQQAAAANGGGKREKRLPGQRTRHQITGEHGEAGGQQPASETGETVAGHQAQPEQGWGMKQQEIAGDAEIGVGAVAGGCRKRDAKSPGEAGDCQQAAIGND